MTVTVTPLNPDHDPDALSPVMAINLHDHLGEGIGMTMSLFEDEVIQLLDGIAAYFSSVMRERPPT